MSIKYTFIFGKINNKLIQNSFEKCCYIQNNCPVSFEGDKNNFEKLIKN